MLQNLVFLRFLAAEIQKGASTTTSGRSAVLVVTAAPESIAFIDKIAVVIAATNIVVQVNEEAIRDLDGGDDFMQLWSYVQFVDAATGVATIAKGISKTVIGAVTKIRIHPDEIITSMNSNVESLKAQALNSYEILKEAYRIMKSVKPQAASDYYKYLFQRIEAVKLRVYNTIIHDSNYDIIVLNEYNVTIKSQAVSKNILVLEQNSTGCFLKGTINSISPPAGSTFCVTFENVRYRNATETAIQEGTLHVYKTSSGVFGVFKGVSGAGRQNWNGLTNVFKANADEIAEATTRIRNHRVAQNAGTQGNYGYLEGNIGSVTKNGDMVRSGAADNTTEIFDAMPVNTQQVVGGEGAWLRNTDSEYKMLNRLANELNAVKGQKYPQITGELKIVSERVYCPSCQGVIQQFNEMYPNVKLILVDGAK